MAPAKRQAKHLPAPTPDKVSGAHEATITVHVPIAVRRRGGRKTVTAAASDDTNASAPRGRTTVSPALRPLARAFRWRRMTENGTYVSVKEIAGAEQLDASFVGRVLNLTRLAPATVQQILENGALSKPSGQKNVHLYWGSEEAPAEER
jgi:hypothetical protein